MAKIDKLSGSKVRIEVEVTAEQFNHGLDHAFHAIKGDVEVKPSPRARVSKTEIEKGKGINLKKPAAGPVSDESFGAVFKRNRKANKATFTFKDKLYTTRIKEESISEHKKKFGVKGKYK